ncbi:hypothetical protein EBZ39_00180 [bacterium]|nr:hypothetical protein [bacterium]
MPRPGFYNDNEYRSYPFVFKPGTPPIPDSAIVDAGVIMRIDSFFDDTRHTVWLAKLTRDSGKFYFEFRTDATDEPLVFVRSAAMQEWQIEYSESATLSPCPNVPDAAWEGFLVTGPLKDLNEFLTADDTIFFNKNALQLEPARIQNLNKAYVRTINIGNYERPVVPECGQANPGATVIPKIILNKACMAGNIKLKEGYNCSIKQTTFANEIKIGASVGAGAPVDAELCANGSELALFPDEPLFHNSKFFSGGPACDELIFTVNGLGGPTVTLTSGNGINIATQTDPPRITISRNLGSTGNCS